MPQTCLYLVPGEQGRQSCGQPATHRYWSHAKLWFPVCATHANQVYKDTRKKVNPTPLPGVVIEEKSVLPLTAVVAVVPAAVDPAATGACGNPTIAEQLRRFREQLESQPDNGTL